MLDKYLPNEAKLTNQFYTFKKSFNRNNLLHA